MEHEAVLSLATHVKHRAKRLRREADELARFASRLEAELADTPSQEDTAQNGHKPQESRTAVIQTD